MGEMVPGGEAAWNAFEAIFEKWQNHGIEKFCKELRPFVASYGWEAIFPITDKKLFFNRALGFYRAVKSTEYSCHRQEQTAKSSYPLWVYHCHDTNPDFGCWATHGQFDGLVLPSDHPFWDVFMPPKSANCCCSFSGARSAKVAEILGGKPNRKLPLDWNKPDDRTGLPFGVDPLFHEKRGPNRKEVLAWIVQGNADLG